MPDAALEARYTEVRQRVDDAMARAGRRGQPVYLVAVTKYAEPEDIRHLVELGHRDFGENRVQQLIQRAAVISEWFDRVKLLPATVSAVERRAASRDLGLGDARGVLVDTAQPVRWHMIGHLQRNKARRVVELCRLVHSVDSLRLAEELQTIGNKLDKPIDVLVQVNVSGEESKEGCPVAAAQALCEQIDSMVHVQVRGLMTMAPLSGGADAARRTFARCREIFEDIQQTGVNRGKFNILSMGMSGDYEIALEEGANVVRVGSAIFGERAEVETPEDAEAVG
jgi:pyridoxal phosphate enzyme (YggS family)